MILFARFTAFVCLFFLSSFSVFGQEGTEPQIKELGFIEKLRAEEEQEYLALQSQIISMSDSEYKAMLAQRMQVAFAASGGSQKLAIVVDVSEQMNQSKGFLNKLLGQNSEPEMMGVASVQTILSETGLSGASGLALIRQESSDDGAKHYQKIEGMFTHDASELLLQNPKVTDVFIVDASGSPTKMETFYVPNGRIIPPPVYKQHSDDVIDEGLYQEVMARLDKYESVAISIGFHEEADYYDPPTVEKELARLAKVDEFLESMKGLSIEIQGKRAFGVDAIVDRAAAKAIYEDPRINYIRLAKEGRGAIDEGQ